MAHDTILSARFSRAPCPLLALLIGALACGEGSEAGTTSATEDAARMPPQMISSAAAAGSPDTSTASERPAELGVSAEGSRENGPDPIRLGADTPPGGGAGEGMASHPPANDPPANEMSANEEPSQGTSLVHGADPTRESATSPGPFEVTRLTTGLRDGADYGSQTLHVPEGAAAPFAAVVVVPGFNTLEASIQPWGPFLASHGIVALTIGTNNPGDSADARARALLDALETIKAENTRAGSPLEGQLALDHLGIMGWSLGGAGVLSAASVTPSLRAAITMAAFSPGGQFAADQVPTLFLAGSADPNAGGQSQGLFASLPEATPKMLFEVRGGPHEIGNDPQNANGEIGRYGLSWLEVFLVGDERYRPFLEEVPTEASDFQHNLTSDR
jgi:dienelactone hydrolase